MNSKNLMVSALTIFSLTACTPSSEEAKEDIYEPAFRIEDCDVELGGMEKARVIDPFGHAGFDPSGKIRLTP